MIRGLVLTALLSIALAQPSFAETRPLGGGGYGTLEKAQSGRPTVIHFWSLTCAPCLAELPRWPEWMRRLGFDLVLISTDFIDQAPQIDARLKRAGLAGVPSHAFADHFTERMLFEIAPGWQGELPRTRVLGATGEATDILGEVSEDQLRRALGRR